MLQNLNYVQCLNIAHMEKAWVYQRLFFEVVIVIVKIGEGASVSPKFSDNVLFFSKSFLNVLFLKIFNLK